VSPTRGRLLSGFGKNTANNGFVGGALYVDHASGKIFHFPQQDFSASTTIRDKQMVEAEANDLGFRIKGYHSDNGIFASAEFKEHCTSQGQSLDFCGVGAHHQNGIAEHSIRTVSGLARANLIHLMLHWPTYCKVSLWPLAVNYAIWIYNRIPRTTLGGISVAPMSLAVLSTSLMPTCKMAKVFPNGIAVLVLVCLSASPLSTRPWCR
jgi:hypothetical protein